MVGLTPLLLLTQLSESSVLLFSMSLGTWISALFVIAIILVTLFLAVLISCCMWDKKKRQSRKWKVPEGCYCLRYQVLWLGPVFLGIWPGTQVFFSWGRVGICEHGWGKVTTGYEALSPIHAALLAQNISVWSPM